MVWTHSEDLGSCMGHRARGENDSPEINDIVHDVPLF